MERHSEAGTVGAGGEYKAVNIPSELQVERAKSALVGCAGFHRYMDIISNVVQLVAFSQPSSILLLHNKTSLDGCAPHLKW